MADEHGVWVALASLEGFEGGKGFPGASVLVNPCGEIVLRGPLFEEAVLTYDVDLEQLTRARAEAPLLADLEVNLPHLVPSLGRRESGGTAKERPAVKVDPAPNGAAPPPPVPIASAAVPALGQGVAGGDPPALDVARA